MAGRKATTKPAAEEAVKTTVPVAGEKKSTEKKTVEKKTETGSVEKTAGKKPEEKAVEAQPAEKAEEKPAMKTAAKKAPAKKPLKKAELKTDMHVQFAGKSDAQEDLVKIARDVWKYDLKQKVRDLESVELYVKPEENMVYYVMNREFTGSFYI